MSATHRILIIDDSATVRSFYRRSLAGKPYEIDEAQNGVEGVERVLSNAYDLLLVDVNMPKMDGYEFVRVIRSAPNEITTPVVMITSEHEPNDRRAAYQAGANLFLMKPVKGNQLLELVRLVTGGAR